jgi:hypothetical protein
MSTTTTTHSHVPPGHGQEEPYRPDEHFIMIDRVIDF